ncbi:MAG: transposase, partial [Candidatus Sumerlaeota bacterium]|nr:transposase [Candidatus Sumerlaeota bacterium]
SSAKAHAQGAKDELLSPKRPFPAPERVGDWSAWLMQGLSEEELNRIRQNTRTGRPSGDEPFIEKLERLLKRLLRPMKRGPKSRQDEESQLI